MQKAEGVGNSRPPPLLFRGCPRRHPER